MTGKKFVCLAIAYYMLVLGAYPGICESDVLQKRIAEDLDSIKSGALSLTIENSQQYFKPTVHVLQRMFEELSYREGEPLVLKGILTPGMYNEHMKNTVSQFQVNFLGMSPEATYLGIFGRTTFQGLLRELRNQSKSSDPTDYIAVSFPTTGNVGTVVTASVSTPEAETATVTVRQSEDLPDLPAKPDHETKRQPMVIKRIITKKHVVKPGDTLSHIAYWNNVSQQKLQRDNDIRDPERIYPGQVIEIRQVVQEVIEEEPGKKNEASSPALQAVQRAAGRVSRNTQTAVEKAKAPQPTGPREQVVFLSKEADYDKMYKQLLAARLKTKSLEELKNGDHENEIILAIGETKIFKNAKAIKKIAVGDPEIADTLLLDSRQLLINAKTLGNTTLTIWDADEKQDVYYVIVTKKSSVVQTRVFTLKNIKLMSPRSIEEISLRVNVIEAIKTILAGIIDEKNFSVFPELNSIVIQGTSGEIERVEDFITKIDVPVEQVLVTARVAEVDKDSSTELKMISEGSTDKVSGVFNESDGGIISYSMGSAFNTVFAQQLRALSTVGKAKILATPKILVQSGEVSQIHVGESIPYLQIVDGEPQIQYMEAGVILSVFPQANSNGTITSYINAEASNLTAELYQGYPSIQKRLATTTMTVKDGETIILAGLVKDTKNETVYKVPLLGDIPLLGELFKSRTTVHKEVELIIAITQHVINKVQ